MLPSSSEKTVKTPKQGEQVVKNTKVRCTILILGIAIAPLMLYWTLFGVINQQNFLDIFKVCVGGIFTISLISTFSVVIACGEIKTKEIINAPMLCLIISSLIMTVFGLIFVSMPESIKVLSGDVMFYVTIIFLITLTLTPCGWAIANQRETADDDGLPSFVESLVGFFYALVVSVVGGSGTFILINNITLFGITPWVVSIIPATILGISLIMLPTKRWKLA